MWLFISLSNIAQLEFNGRLTLRYVPDVDRKIPEKSSPSGLSLIERGIPLVKKRGHTLPLFLPFGFLFSLPQTRQYLKVSGDGEGGGN